MRIGVTLIVALSVLSSCRDEEPATCSIAGVSVAADALDPTNACQVCKPDVSRTEWTALADAASCGTAKFCRAASCVSACVVGDAVVTADALSPTNTCASCQPAVSTSAYSPLADGVACGAAQLCSAGQCAASCFIGGAAVAANASSPANSCATCQPSVSTTGYSPLADGATCGAGQVCLANQCVAGCFIDGALVTADALAPTNNCTSCQPALSTSAYSPLALGTSCGAGQFCSASQCAPGCFINGAVVGVGAVDPSNRCESCQPLVSSTGYTTLAEGASCGAGQVCTANVCTAGCFIGGAFIAEGAADPANPCLACRSTVSTTAYSALDDGASCGLVGELCVSGSCLNGCLIGGAAVQNEAVNPANACEQCVPVQNNTAYSVRADGETCGAGLVCNTGACTDQCFISGAFIDAGVQTTNRCGVCAPSSNTSSYSPMARGTRCTACNSCDSQGNCAPTQLAGTGVATNDLPNSLLLAGDDLYFVNNRRDPCCRSEVRRTSRDGGATQVLAAGLYGPTGMTMQDGALFISDVQANTVVRVAIDGGLAPDGGPWRTIASMYGASSVISTSMEVIYGGFDGNVSPSSLRSVRHDGSAPFTYSPALPTALATAGGALYWGTASGTISRTPVGTVGSMLMASGLGRVNKLAFHENSLVFTASGGVFQLPLSGGPAVALATGQNDPLGVVSDGQNIYFTNYAMGFGGAPVDTVNRVPLDGGPAVVLYRGEPGISLAVDNQCVYFTTYNSSVGVRRTDK